ncbi:hypothetical protein BC828DRAFT_402338 [Blastocladiella britannica]|nr:hypothetical protein BC828DRAFT_402338 [Blastocladiella britannica]
MNRPVLTPLFGGAIAAALPAELVDVSDFRQVPDNQEVWVDQSPELVPVAPVEGDGDEKKSPPQGQQPDSASLIIELLEMDADVGNDALAAFHFAQLVSPDDGDSSNVVIDSVTTMTPAAAVPAIAASGFPVAMQRAVGRLRSPKFRNHGEHHHVHVLMWVVRIPHVRTDLVVTWNLPVGVHAPTIPGLPPSTSTTAREIVAETGVSAPTLARCEAVVRSLEVVDWNLFC